MPPQSQIISIARCASRYVMPPAPACPRRALPAGRPSPYRTRNESRPCPSLAIAIASSITERRPRSSMSRIVKACTPDCCTCLRSCSSTRGSRPAPHCAGPPWARSRRCASAPRTHARCSRPAACRARCRWGWSPACSCRHAHRSRSGRASRPCSRRCARHPGDGPDRDRMIAAQHQRDTCPAPAPLAPCPPAACRSARSAADTCASRGPSGYALRLRHRDVAQVLHLIAERRQPGIQIRHAHRRRTHVDAAASRAQIQRRADDRDVQTAACSRPRPVQHARERDGFADMLQPAHPGHEPLHAHAEAGVRHRCRTCADPDTSRTLPCGSLCSSRRCSSKSRSWMRWPPPMISP